jgi:predicted RNA polymerase sigma factor
MLLTDARRAARTGPAGEPVPLADQDRSRWDAALIGEGVALVTGALRHGPPGPYQLQAAIAAVHDEAPSAPGTDWPQIVALYELLRQADDNPVTALNHAVAVAMCRGPEAGLDLLEPLAGDQRITSGHRFHSVRAHLLEMAGDHTGARESYLEAARRAGSLPRQRYLNAQATRLGQPD